MSTPSPSPASSRRVRCRATTRIKYATSILDYVFRELAVSYMSRFDLAHVDPNESGFDALGKGVEEGKEPEDSQGHQATKYLSKGLTRSRTDNLVVMRGGSAAISSGSDNAPAGGSKVTSLSQHGASARVSDTLEGAVALKQEAQHELRRPRSWKRCNGARPVRRHRPRRARPSAAPRPKPRATRARCAASAATSPWCATAPA